MSNDKKVMKEMVVQEIHSQEIPMVAVEEHHHVSDFHTITRIVNVKGYDVEQNFRMVKELMRKKFK